MPWPYIRGIIIMGIIIMRIIMRIRMGSHMHLLLSLWLFWNTSTGDLSAAGSARIAGIILTEVTKGDISP